MWNGFIGQRITANTKNLWRWSITLLVSAALVGLPLAKRLDNVLQGPRQVDAAQLATLSSASWRDYVIVKGDQTVSTGVTEIENTTESGQVVSQTTTGEYMAMVVGNRILVVKTHPGVKNESYTGAIVALPADLKKQVLAGEKDPDLEAAILPVMLDAARDYRGGVILGCISVGLLLLLSLWTWIKSKRRTENPEVHPLSKALSKYGPLHTLVPEIDEEAKRAISTLGGATFTINWIILASLFRTVVIHRDEIVWVYKKRTKHSVYFIPTGSSYELILRDARGKRLELSAPEQHVDSYLVSLAQQTPWVTFGFDKKIERLYRKQRPAFIEAVAGRKNSDAVEDLRQA